MAGNVRFSVAVVVKNGDILPELMGRLTDMSPAFEAIVPEWAKVNEEKFGEARGAETIGAQVDDLVFWDPLRAASSKAKRRRGRADWLLVDTGDLKRALTDPDLLFQRIDAKEAAFGTPLNLEEADKVRFNWAKRQAIFISTADQNTIRRIVQDYLSMGQGFQERRFAKGVAALKLRAEVAQMDADFNADALSEES